MVNCIGKQCLPRACRRQLALGFLLVALPCGGWAANLPAPSLSSPSNGATNQSTAPTFSWSPVTGASSYRIMVATSASALPTNVDADTCAGCVINATPQGTSYPA